jgi:neutral trehalase
MDNSQRFDGAIKMDAVDFSCYMKNEYDCLAEMESALGLVREAEQSRSKAAEISRAVNQLLWNEKTGFYTDRYMDGSLSDVMAVSGFLPLWAGIADAERAEILKKQLLDPKTFASPMPIPSAALCDPEYSTDMWRGGVWLNCNYMIIHGLKRYHMEDVAREITRKTIDSVARWYGQCGAIYEFFHAEDRLPPQMLNRKGPCVPPVDIRRKYFPIADYGWSGALVIALLLEGLYPFPVARPPGC